MSEGDTAGAGDPARGTPAGPVPAVGARAADELGLWVATAGAGDPVCGIPAGPVPAARARVADELGALGGHCRCG